MWLPTTYQNLISDRFLRYFWLFSSKFYKNSNSRIFCQLYGPKMFRKVKDISKNLKNNFWAWYLKIKPCGFLCPSTVSSQVKVFLTLAFVSKGGQPCFSKISNWLTLKWYNFFVFDSNKKSLKIPAKPTIIFYPAKFWDLRPHNRPEISVGPKKCVFLALGVTRWPAPPLFSWIMIKFKTNIFLLKPFTCVL